MHTVKQCQRATLFTRDMILVPHWAVAHIRELVITGPHPCSAGNQGRKDDCIIWPYITLHYMILYVIKLYYIVLNYIILCTIIFYYIIKFGCRRFQSMRRKTYLALLAPNVWLWWWFIIFTNTKDNKKKQDKNKTKQDKHTLTINT